MSNVTSVSSQPEKSNRWNVPTAAALALSVALAGGNAYLLVKTDRLENQMKELKAAFKTELVSVQQEVASRGNSYNKVTEDLRKQIEDTGARSAMAANAASRANNAAKKYSDDLAKKLAEQQKMVSDQHQTLTAQLGEMKDASTQTYAKVNGIATDVTNVKTEVASTKTELDKTIAICAACAVTWESRAA
jgi:chromosome segregation ATPase